MDAVNIKLDKSKLNDLVRRFAGGERARVGVLADGTARTDSKTGENNASLGLVHELGSDSRGIPARSFIRMPLEKQQGALAETAANQFGKAVEGEQSTTEAMEKIALKAEGIIDEAFSTGGYGQWPANKAETVKRKGSAMPLIDTAQLAASISSKVVKDA